MSFGLGDHQGFRDCIGPRGSLPQGLVWVSPAEACETVTGLFAGYPSLWKLIQRSELSFSHR